MIFFGQAVFACPIDIQPILAKVGNLPTNGEKNSPFFSLLWRGHQEMAALIWSEYQNGRWDFRNSEMLASCLRAPLNDADLKLALNEQFLKSSLARVRSINPTMFDQFNASGQLNRIRFRVFDGHEQSQIKAIQSIGDRPAGFNLESQSLMINLAAIDRHDWDVIFIHEMGHFLEQAELAVHLRAVNHREDLLRIERILKDQTLAQGSAPLSSADRSFLKAWLVHAANIRLLAEWRIWKFTLNYIQNRPIQFLGRKTLWLEEFLRMNEVDRPRELFKFLDQRFKNPDKGVFAHPTMQQLMVEVRQELLFSISKE